MRSVKLRVFTDDVSGTRGLLVADAPRNDDTLADIEGVLTAHDVLEHVNGARNIGTIDDELEAMGAAWRVRGEYGQITRHYNVNSPRPHIAADVSRMACEFLRGEYVDLHNIPRTRACDADAAIDDILRIAEADAIAERRYDAGPDGTERIDRDRLALYMTAARARMRIGYRKAARKYRGIDPCALFWRIADAVGAAVKNADLYDGAEFTLRIDGALATCEQIYD